MLEYVIVASVITAATAFAVWRVWLTLRVSKGKADAHNCGKCPANQRA